MVEPATPPANRFVRWMRKVYNPLGFSKGYNFILFFIFGGALFGFALARSMFFNVSGIFCGPPGSGNRAAPGECYYYMNVDQYEVGIRVHLFTILPAGLLAVFQFVPIIRYKLMIFHRVNGYITILLLLTANAGALMIARRAFGGTLATQSLVGTLAILTTTGLVLAYYNIKVLQIDQHRAWMLRVWFYAASIITLRLIMIIAANVIGLIGTYYMVQPCEKLDEIFRGDAGRLIELYPTCTAWAASSTRPRNTFYTIVNAKYAGGNTAEIGTALNMVFGMSGWIALVMHAAGVEIYLHLTPKESHRLRTVSYQRQLEANFKHAGNAGLTPQRIGDADAFEPQTKQQPSADVARAVDMMDPTKPDGNALTEDKLRPQVPHKQISDSSNDSDRTLHS